MVVKSGRKYKYLSTEQKLAILKEIDRGESTIKGAAHKYGISRSMIFYWRKSLLEEQYGEFQKQIVAKESQTILREQDLEKEIEKLKIKLAEAYLEVDFLKKARSSIARGRRSNSSVVTAQNLDRFHQDAE